MALKFTLATLASCAIAINLEDEATMQAPLQGPYPGPYQPERTIVGFLFSGFDFGALWEQLTQSEREIIKKEVFRETLQLNGFDATEYPDNEFTFTEEERTAA